MKTTLDLTKEQAHAVEGIKKWFTKESKHYVTMVGFAGTGKTFLTKHIIEELKLPKYQVAFVSFTGKAALVLQRSVPDYECSTIIS
ncbi:AAA family ATPase [Bacillus salitolerans]|uniref:AAA family ATPase n=1 Tax=Bacillus salitolerans TaxID=1437434 RepID=A0ABW4LN44_9BACI